MTGGADPNNDPTTLLASVTVPCTAGAEGKAWSS